jgi:hypothetical protein
MGKNVFANGMEVVHQAGDSKVIAAFPDVCLSPPPPPAGPVPVPYPNTSKAADLKEGSKTVVIGGKPAGLKDSHYKTSPLGDEAATRNFGGSVVTHVITGKTQFASHSMDVTFEGKAVVRHLDLTGSNAASPPESTPPTGGTLETAVGTDASDTGPKCDCCGKAAHSANQAAGAEISEKDFYAPTPAGKEQRPQFALEAEALLREVRSGPCKNLLPPANPTSKTKCHKYYLTDMVAEGEATTREQRRIENRWNAYRQKYFRKFKVPPGTDIGHRVPKTAGGCPTGPGNLTPVKPECLEIEQRLSRAQERAIRYHRARHKRLTALAK